MIASGAGRMVPQSYLRGGDPERTTISARSELDARLRRSHPPAQPERPQSSHQRLQQRHQAYGRRSQPASPGWAPATAPRQQPGDALAAAWRISGTSTTSASAAVAAFQQLTLTPWLHYCKTRDWGRSQLGRIDNDLYNAGLTLAGGGGR
ncbi:hypothetical protein ACPA9J_19080 [Pseudomonas aeruginosa]